MSRSNAISRLLLSFVTLFLLQACGDDSDRSKDPVTEYENYRELQLTSLVVTVGGEPVELAPRFDSRFIGPYVLEVGEDVESIQLTPTLFDDSNLMEIAKKELVYEDGVPKKDDNGNLVLTNFGDARLVTSGETDTRTIREGDNFIVVRISPSDSNVSLTYSLHVRRPSTNAEIWDLAIRDNSFDSDSNEDQNRSLYLTLDPEFSADVTQYSGSAPYEACTVSPILRTAHRYTSVELNGKPISHFDFIMHELAVGANTLSFVSTPEAGDGVITYNIDVTRLAPTDTQLGNDATLSDISVSGGRLTEDFHCRARESMPYNNLLNQHSVIVNNEVDTIEISSTPSVEGAVLTFGTPLYEGTEIVGVEDGVEMVPGENLSLALELGLTIRVIQVESTSGSVIAYYRLFVRRLTNNQRLVETAEQLQDALKNAQPNDDILIYPGVYEGVAGEQTSGNAGAHFYSEQSGTEDSPIVLRPANNSGQVVLLGSSEQDAAALLLAGDHWRISGLYLNNTHQGLILDGASNNTINSISVSNVDERAVHFRNGSSNNILQRSIIFNTGLDTAEGRDAEAEAVVIGSNVDDWISAPDGSRNEQDNNNVVVANFIGPSVSAEAIDIREGTYGTIIRHNIFDLSGISDAAEDGAAVVIKGNDVELAYNQFLNESGAGIDQLVALKNVERDWTAVSWGENARVFQNTAHLGNAEIPFVNSNDVMYTGVTENARQDEASVTYAGTGIDESFSQPVFVVHSTLEETLCFSEVKFEESDTAGFLILDDCSNAENQQWQMHNAENGYVFLTQANDSSNAVYPNSSEYLAGSSQARSVVASLPEDEGLAQGHVFRWRLIYSQDGISFANKGYRDSSWVLHGGTESGDYVTIRAFTASGNQLFTVEEI